MADTYQILRESYNYYNYYNYKYFSYLVSLLILMILTRSGPMADTYQILRESYNYFSDLQFLDSSPRISAVSGFKTCLVGLEPNTMNSAENEDQWLISSYILSLVVILSLTVNKCGDREK